MPAAHRRLCKYQIVSVHQQLLCHPCWIEALIDILDLRFNDAALLTFVGGTKYAPFFYVKILAAI